MILATVGTMGYDRLVEAVEQLAARTQEDVVIQGGNSEVAVVHAEFHAYLSDLNHHIERASLVISHCGVGTIYKLLQAKKPAVIVPRRAHLGEHFDDHQWVMAQKMKGRLPFVFVDDITELEQGVENCPAIFHQTSYSSTRNQLIDALAEDIKGLMR